MRPLFDPETSPFLSAQMTVLSIFFQVFMVPGKHHLYGMCTFFYVYILLGKIYLQAQCIFVIKSIVLLHRRCTSWNKLATILQYKHTVKYRLEIPPEEHVSNFLMLWFSFTGKSRGNQCPIILFVLSSKLIWSTRTRLALLVSW